LGFVEEHKIDMICLGNGNSRKAWNPVSEEAVLRALTHILNPLEHPLQIICQLGRHRTGQSPLGPPYSAF
jgi:hypothetical protein